MGEGGLDLMEKYTPELPRGNLPADPVEMTGLKSIDHFSDSDLVAEEVAKKPDIVHGYTDQERNMGQGYGEGYRGGGVIPEIDIPSNLSDSSLESMGKYSGEMDNIPKGDMMDLMKLDYKMEAGINQRGVRKQAYNRYKEKMRKQRTNPTIRYKSRKKIADNRPRSKGRFVKTGDKVSAGYKKLTKSQMKSKKKTKTKAKKDLMKAKKTLKRALARYNKVMKM